MSTNTKNALMITGAAARISQEVASIDKLIEKKGLQISSENTVLAGFSSGSLNLLALNLCFGKNAPLNWNTDYKEKVLWNLKNNLVYTKSDKLVPIFDTSPLRKTLDAFLNSGGVKQFGDLTIDSFVLAFSDRHLTTEWAANFGAKNQSVLTASDLFMASTAIPIAFPSQVIGDDDHVQRNFPNGHFSDGGTGGQFRHFEDNIGQYVLEHGPFQTLNIISPMREEGAKEMQQLKEGLHGQSFKQLSEEELGKFAATLSFDSFMKFLNAIKTWEAQNGPVANETFVSIPKMNQNFGILDFDNELEQYNTTCDWIDNNPEDFAVPLEKFIEQQQ